MDRRTDEIDEPVAIETANGRLAGARKAGILSFKGIPYATPPVGPLRWRMPEPGKPWAGVRDAKAFARICPQAPSQLETLMGSVIAEQSEDCLYLNIWTPGCDDAKRPVMVWIHGGAFVIGAGSQGIYNGKHIAARDVVVVTINYRLGAFGFLAMSDATDGKLPGTGNEGLADQILALDWVKRNIAVFGGDPDNVTIFGESAGGMSIGALLACAPAQGLFHKAIPQSGGAHIGHDRDRGARAGRAILDEMGLSVGDAMRALEAPYGAIVKAQIGVLADSRDGRDARKLGRLPFQPVVDGALLPVTPIDAVRGGSAAGVPILTGTMREEWKLFSAADPRLRLMTAKGFSERVTRLAKEFAPDVIAAYAGGSPFERFNAVMTDKSFTVPAVRLADAQALRAPVYLYRFDWRSPFLGGIMGSCHALELGFVFGTHKEKLAGAFFGTGPVAEALSHATIDAWTAFARTGAPSTPSTGPWPRYESASRQTMILGDGPPHLTATPDEAHLRAWDNVPERKLGP
jgi:para-nitrobenzyl esterase